MPRTMGYSNLDAKIYQDAKNKSRKFLKDILGNELFNKFIKEGKIDVQSGNTTYELHENGRVVNKTTNQSYCIVPDRPDYPDYDIIAIKYAWLKYGQRTVERVANRTSLEISTSRQGVDNTVGYDAYVHHMESNGWRRERLSLDENNTNIVSTYGVEKGYTGDVVTIRCPSGMAMTMMGISQVPPGADGRSAYSLALRVADKNDVEISGDTSIRIDKIKPSEVVVMLARCPYSLFSLKRRVGNEEHNIWADKTDNELYRWRMGVHLLGEELLRVFAINSPVTIPCENVKIMMETDLWIRER